MEGGNIFDPANPPQQNGSTANRTFNNNPSNNYGSTNNFEGLMSNFMASQEARIARFEAEFNQQQNEMTNKIDHFIKALNNQGVTPATKVLKTLVLELRLKILHHLNMCTLST